MQEVGHLQHGLLTDIHCECLKFILSGRSKQEETMEIVKFDIPQTEKLERAEHETREQASEWKKEQIGIRTLLDSRYKKMLWYSKIKNKN